MIYDDYLTTAELQRWILETDVSWNSIRPELALAQPELLEQIRDSALIESYFPLYTTNLLRACWDQVDLTAVFSVQLYESYKHFYVLNRYLEVIGYRPLTDRDLIDVRANCIHNRVEDPLRELARYMISEHFAAYFFLRASRQAKEPSCGRSLRSLPKTSSGILSLPMTFWSRAFATTKRRATVCWKPGSTLSTSGQTLYSMSRLRKKTTSRPF